MTEPDESQKDMDCYCKSEMTTRTLSAEQLYLWLKDRRDKLRRERQSHLTAADRINTEIAAYDQLLTELII